jgi:hypothetical protein
MYKGIFSIGMAVYASLLTQTDLRAADSPAHCDGQAEVQTISLIDWEAGLGAWSVGTYDVARADTFDTPDWDVVGNLPGGRTGNAAFVANLDIGNCSTDDESGVLTLTSPAITIPADAEGQRLAFNHWFDIEYGWDGGNLKISVNGDPFTLLPASQFQTGAYADVLFPAVDEFGIANSTNPLAGQEAFTGPEGDQTTGSWRESRIDLQGIAGPGDSIRLRFDLGVDACFGKTGWYVDEIEVYSCGESQTPSNPRLTLVKEVINDHGGTAPASAWTLTADGPSGFSGSGPSVSSGSDFVAGTYNLSESGGPAGYSAGAWACSGGTQVDTDTIMLEPGDDVTCSITNDDIGPKLRLVKTIVNDSGGLVTNPNDFGLRIDGFLVGNNSNYILTAGPHRASEDGLPGYEPGPWGGDCTPDGSITLALGETATCTITNDDSDDVSPEFQINAGHSGAWYNPVTSGQGQFIDVEPGSQYMFISWFTYTDSESANPSEQRWFTAQGNYSGNMAQLTLNETLGGKFDDPQAVNTEAVGEVIIEVADCENGTMTYQIESEDLQGEFPLRRVIPASGGVCAEKAANRLQTVEINAGMDGAWYDPQTTGQGFFIDAHPDPEGGHFIFISWFTYGSETASGQRWLTAQGSFEGSTATIDISETTGGSFDDPQPTMTDSVGTMSLDFSDCSQALLTYSLPAEGIDGQIDLVRVVPGGEALCEEMAAAE